MSKTEQELARELDMFLTATMQGRPFSPETADIEAEARLASELLDLAGTLEPEPDFTVGLEAHLARVAAGRKRSRPEPRRSAWQAFTQMVKEGIEMKRMTVALGTLAAVILIGAAVFFVSQRGGGIEPGAVAGIPAADVPDVTTDADAPDAVAADLPALPRLGSSGMGTGYGGGGGGDLAAADQPAASVDEDAAIAIDEPFFWNPLREATYVLNTTLPTEPQQAIVYQQPGNGFYTQEDAERLAQAFGFSGPLYTEVFQVHEGPDGELWTPPTIYLAFDDLRTLSVSDAHFYYYDQGANPDYAPGMAGEQAMPIAEAFLQDRGLLDFDYVLRAPYGVDVQVHRVLDGRMVTMPEYFVSVAQDGQVFSLSSTPLPELVAGVSYPLRSAEAAWQQLQAEGIDYDTTIFMTYPGPDFEQPLRVEVPVEEQLYRYWERSYADGDSINLYAYPMVYKPLDETAAPRIQLDRYRLTGSTDDLWAISDYAGQQLHVTGIIRGENVTARTLEVSSWEVVENAEYQYMPGSIRRDGEQVLFDAEQGETFLIPDAPADLPDGEKVYVNGWSIEPGDGAYREFNWQGIDRIVEEQPIEQVLPVDQDMVDEYKITQVDITEVELVYAMTPTYDEATQTSTFYVQPAWRFRGMTDTDEIIELYVQAVDDTLLRPTK